MDESEYQPAGFTRGVLPWVLALFGLIVYGATLNKWVSFGSLEVTALALNIDWWDYKIGHPFFYLVATPVRWLPAEWQIVGLNCLAALCGALALAQLARTVAILPQDRTHDQRLRNPDSQGLLRSPSDWLPPVFAVLVCGFQLTFWEQATVAGPEILNLLLFAFVIRCLAEFRLVQHDRWLFTAAFIYGLGIATNWAMTGFLPLFGLAVLWVKGGAFFNWRFLLSGFGLMLGGMLLYLFDPLMGALDKSETTSFAELITWEFVSQRNPLLGMPKGRVLMLSVTSIVPLSLLAIRWPSNFGDVSGFGVALASLLMRVVHLVFFVAIIAVAFDPAFSPRALGYGLPMLTFYYLGALLIGYLAGYFLLICGTQPVKRWQQASGLARLVNGVLLVALWLGVVAVPALLLRKNLPVVRVENNDLLRRYVGQVAADLPESKVLLTGSDERLLLLLATYFHQHPGSTRLIAPLRDLVKTRFHFRAAAAYPGEWPAPVGLTDEAEVSTGAAVSFLGGMHRTGYPVWSVDGIEGHVLMEEAVAEPHGHVYELKPLPATNQFDAAALTVHVATIRALADQTEEDIATGSRTAEEVGILYSGWVNTLGVRLQLGGRAEEAGWAFRTALDFNPDNICAAINLDVHTALGTNGPGISPAVSGLEREVVENRSWQALLRRHGPIDEAGVRSYFGRLLLSRSMPRQAELDLARAVTLNGTNVAARLSLVEARVRLARYSPARESLGSLVAQVPELEPGQREEFTRLMALIELGEGEGGKAESRLLTGLEEFEESVKLRRALADLYIADRRFTNAVPVLEKLVEIDPEEGQFVSFLASVYSEVERYEEAQQLFAKLISDAPEDPVLRLNRGSLRIRQGKLDEAEADYRKALELNASLMRGHAGLAEISVKRGETNAAIAHMETALKLTVPGSRDAAKLQRRLQSLGPK